MPEIPLRLLTLTQEVCVDNFDYWLSSIKIIKTNPAFQEIKDLSFSISPAHTFAYRYFDSNTGKYFYPLKSIFGYDETSKQFNPNANGLIAASKRKISGIPNNHMSTSQKLGHDIFIFAYHGVHNPYHRHEDAMPIKPFGLFFKKEIEDFPYCHGSPCDVAEKNLHVDRTILKRYYLFPENLREFKAHQICYDNSFNHDFWYNYGNPTDWISTENYGSTIYENTGEFRYLEIIPPSSVEAILWPFAIDKMLPGNIPDMDDNLDLYNSFKKAFPNISIINYTFEEGSNKNWALALVEASFYSTKYFIKYKKYPQNAQVAKLELNH